MQVTVRINGILASKIGIARLAVRLPAPATIQDLHQQLQSQYPHLSAEISGTVAVIGGAHQAATAVLQDGQEVALLMPIAGGC
jgi:molybdopterin synthase catalytic subunit/molybdopterin synthase sulfur carrier subunit